MGAFPILGAEEWLPGWGHENAVDTSYPYGMARSRCPVLVYLMGQALPAHPSGQSRRP